MRLHSLYSLVLLQIISLHAASEKIFAGSLIQHEGFQEYQSPDSAVRNDSFVVDTNSEYILDWADLADGKPETVRAVALVCAQFNQKKKRNASEQLKLFFNALGITLLRSLKKILDKDEPFGRAHSFANLSEIDWQVVADSSEVLKERKPDLHMLIFNRKPALVLQGE